MGWNSRSESHTGIFPSVTGRKAEKHCAPVGVGALQSPAKFSCLPVAGKGWQKDLCKPLVQGSQGIA